MACCRDASALAAVYGSWITRAMLEYEGDGESRMLGACMMEPVLQVLCMPASASTGRSTPRLLPLFAQRTRHCIRGKLRDSAAAVAGGGGRGRASKDTSPTEP
jgi:hypothetical protein